MKLDLGCGSTKRTDFIGVDCLRLEGVDIVHDLNEFPYPFAADSIDEIWMDQVLEHLEKPVRVMEEIYRICRPGARITISVPYFRSFYSVIDPTHRNFFGVYWFCYFDPGHPFQSRYNYSKAKFRVLHREFDRTMKTGGTGVFHRLLIRFAEKRPETYEARLSHFFPLSSLTYHLEAVK